jgi:RHS repeat-associated protein
MFVTDTDNREVLEYDGSTGATQRWYAFGQGPDAVLNQMNTAAGTRETMIPDIQGSIIGTLASGGALTKIGYQPFGENPTLTTGTYRYTARRFDPETAGSTAQPSGLYYYRARTYSPTWGRFLRPDPIGYAAGSNLYAYANNDPLNRTDPLGLCDNPQGCGGSNNLLISTSTLTLGSQAGVRPRVGYALPETAPPTELLSTGATAGQSATQASDGNNIQLAASATSPDYAARILGYSRNTFGKMIHSFKEFYGLSPSDNLIFHDNGDVYFRGSLLGNIHDFAP